MSDPLPFYIDQDDPPAKREILRAGLKLFSERGYAATSIRDIAECSGYTNPALYRHFASKEELALHLFEVCHRRIWTDCARALETASTFGGKLDAYLTEWLTVMDEHPEVIAFLFESARVLWPAAGPQVKRHTVIELARSLMRDAPAARAGSRKPDPYIAAASLQGTLAELFRMIQVGVLEGPAISWKADLLVLFHAGRG